MSHHYFGQVGSHKIDSNTHSNTAEVLKGENESTRGIITAAVKLLGCSLETAFVSVTSRTDRAGKVQRVITIEPIDK